MLRIFITLLLLFFSTNLFAEESKETLHKSVSEVVNQLERQLAKRKGKMNTH